jgi:K+-transporting ATPase KdpF subunit
MVMAGFYLFAGIVAADLLMYLVTALLFPEDFLRLLKPEASSGLFCCHWVVWAGPSVIG